MDRKTDIHDNNNIYQKSSNDDKYNIGLYRAINTPITNSSKFYKPNVSGYYGISNRQMATDFLDNGYIWINTSGNDEQTLNTAVHEINHAIQDVLLPSYIDDSMPYDARKHEHHGAVMTLRRVLGLHPSKRDYTEDDAKEIYEVSKEINEPDVQRFFNYLKNKYKIDTEFNRELKNILNN